MSTPWLCSITEVSSFSEPHLTQERNVSSADTVKLHPEAQMVQHSSAFLHSAVLWCAKMEMGGGKKKKKTEKTHTHGQDP